MSERNYISVKTAAAILNGIVEAGHGDAELSIVLDHGTDNSDEEIDLGIDKITVLNTYEDIAVMIESYMFNETIKKMLDRFRYKLELE